MQLDTRPCCFQCATLTNWEEPGDKARYEVDIIPTTCLPNTLVCPTLKLFFIHHHTHCHSRTEDALGELLKEIEAHPATVRFEAMANVIALHSQSEGKHDTKLVQS